MINPLIFSTMYKPTIQRLFSTIFLLSIFLFGGQFVFAQTLAEKLGYDKDAILLIINNDDAGMSHASNMGTIKGMSEGSISSATIMFPCSWSKGMVEWAKQNPQYDFGVHLTLTSEWKSYKWGTVANPAEVASLLDENGHMYRSVEEVYEHGDPKHAYLEGKAQIEKAIAYGLPFTHIDSHMGTYQLNPAYIEVYLKLAQEYNVPLRMASQSTLEKFGMGQLRSQAASMGLVFTDYMVYEELQDYNDDVEGFWLKVINNLQPGVTELYVHASELTPELSAISGTAKKRAAELATFSSSEKIKAAMKAKNVHIISYRPLLELQRKQK
jgi:predicted glycoside hydrolase/deacetylase ChbG (UPF0249 family)